MPTHRTQNTVLYFEINLNNSQNIHYLITVSNEWNITTPTRNILNYTHCITIEAAFRKRYSSSFSMELKYDH